MGDLITTPTSPPDEIVTFISTVEEREQPLHPIQNGARDLLLRTFRFPPEERAWRRNALCAGMGDAIFFPERGYSMLDAYVICHSCPVRVECLSSALKAGDNHGVRGGFTPYEREKIKLDLANGVSLKNAMRPRDESREGKLRKARAKHQAQTQALLTRGEVD